METTPILLGLLLVATSSQQNCQVERGPSSHIVYNTTEEIKTYYCNYNKKDISKCEDTYNGKEVNTPGEILDKCKFTVIGILRRVLNFYHDITLCEVPAHVQLLQGTVMLPKNEPCKYCEGKCYDRNVNKDTFWMPNVYTELHQICISSFEVCTDPKNQKFIKNQNNTIQLTQNFYLCKTELWKTNVEGIIVANCANCNDTIKSCNITRYRQPRSKGNSSNQPETYPNKTWYIYEYQVNITVHFCFLNMNSSCASMKMGKTVTIDILNQYGDTFCENDKSRMVFCEKEFEIDIEKDQIRELPTDCKYSSGSCKRYMAFWHYTDRCGTVKKTDEGSEKRCINNQCRDVIGNSRKLSLLRQGKLCGENVLYTYTHGLVVSENELFFSSTKYSGEDIFPLEMNQVQSNQELEISNLQTSVRYLTLIIVLLMLWYLINVVVNCCSLKILSKTRTVKYNSYLNCVSQSLTTRYILLSDKRKGKSNNGVECSELHETVENDIYNKAV